MTEANHALLTRKGKAAQKVNSRALSRADVPAILNRMILDQAAGKEKDTCWIWNGSYSHNGYGRWVGQVNGRSKAFVVHRASYAILVGDVPAGLIVRHTCDCPPCFNPEHLVVCTQLENMHDKAAKGRSMWSSTTSEQRIAMMKLAHKRSTDSRGRLGQVDKASTPHVVGYPLVSGSSPSPFNDWSERFCGFYAQIKPPSGLPNSQTEERFGRV